MRTLSAALLACAAVVAACGSGSSGSAPHAGSHQSSVPAISSKVTTSATAHAPPPQRVRPPAAHRIAIGGFFAFKTPSGRIGCAVTQSPTTLRCDTAYPTRFSHTGHRCVDGDYGHAFEIQGSGAATAICAGDTVLSANGAKTIPYGQTWLLGPYSCTSQAAGLACRGAGGHGLFLSLQAQRLF